MSERFTETADNIRLAAAVTKLQELKSGTVVPIPLMHIDQSENIRREINTTSLEFKQLVGSIKEVGLLQNPIVTVVAGKILCVAGHRRIAAMSTLGAEKVPCVVTHFENLDKKDLAQIIENTARQSLSPFDLADQLYRLKKKGFSQTTLQELIGRNRQVVGRYQKLAEWPADLRKLAETNPEKFTVKRLMELARVSDQELLRKKCLEITEKNVKRQGASTKKGRRLTSEVFTTYCKEKKFTKTQVAFLVEVLSELSLLSSQ